MSEAEQVRPIVLIILKELLRAEEHLAIIHRLMGEAHRLAGYTHPSVTRDHIAVAEQAVRKARDRAGQWHDAQAMVIPLDPADTTATLRSRRLQDDTA